MYRKVLDYRVAYGETDRMGFVYYGNYLLFFERARTELCRMLGMVYADLEARGIGTPVIEAHVNYHSPAHYDDVLQFYADVTELKGVRFTISFRIMRGETLLVDGYTTVAFMSMATGRPVRIDPETRAILDTVMANNGKTPEELEA